MMSMPRAATPENIDLAVKRLVEVVQPSRIILFGSVARGEAGEDSDIDLLVVLPEEPESVCEVERHIDRVLDGIGESKDVLVISEERLAEVGDRPSLVYREALREGRVVYEAPSMSPRQKRGGRREPSDAGLPHWWLEHARRDLALARLAYETDLDFAEQVCFHAQQAAEKAIKAVLLARNVEYPYTHNLKKLVAEVTKRGMVVPPDVTRAGALTRYAVKTRYPTTKHEITDNHIADAMAIAEASIAWASELVANPKES